MAQRDWYSAEEVDQLLKELRDELLLYMDKQIILGNDTPDPSETSLYLDVTKTET